MTPKRTSMAGFTLIETLVAFAILGLASGVIMSVISKNPIKIAHVENLRHATAAAQSLLASVGNEQALNVGTRRGQMSDGTGWSLAIQSYDDGAEADEDSKKAPVTLPYLITVTATSGVGGTAESATLTSLRLRNAPP